MNKMPVFVKIDEYKEVLDAMSLIKGKIEDAKKTLEKINGIKNEEDKELEAWQRNLEDIEHKVLFVDKSLFEPEAVQ